MSVHVRANMSSTQFLKTSHNRPRTKSGHHPLMTVPSTPETCVSGSESTNVLLLMTSNRFLAFGHLAARCEEHVFVQSSHQLFFFFLLIQRGSGGFHIPTCLSTRVVVDFTFQTCLSNRVDGPAGPRLVSNFRWQWKNGTGHHRKTPGDCHEIRRTGQESLLGNVFAPVLSSNMVLLKIWACSWLCLDGFFLTLSPSVFRVICLLSRARRFASKKRSRRVESHESTIKIFGSVKHDNTKAAP